MFVHFKDSEKYLYHYTSAETATTHILAHNSLKVGRFVNTNDPKECKDWQFSAGTNEGRNLEGYDLAPLSKRMSAAFKERTNVICFCRDRPLTGVHFQDVYERGFFKPRMWAQYGGNHTGLCLIFERSKLKERIESAFKDSFAMVSGPVQYKNRPLIGHLRDTPYGINVDYLERLGEQEYVRAHIRTHFQRLFFEKCEDWAGEDEFRWVVFETKGDDLFFDFGDALQGIVFGASCTAQTIRAVVDLRRETPTWFEQVVWKGCTPWVSWRISWASPGLDPATNA